MAQPLPTWVTSFIGREEEKAQLAALLADARVVTLTGAGGCGKTRLAVELARDGAGEFADAIYYVDLAPITEPSLVAREVASAFSIIERADEDVTDALVIALRDRELLLVLDNCEHLIAACSELASVLLGGCPGVTLLTTSREPLGVEGEIVFRVPSLEVPATDSDLVGEAMKHDALELFVDRARRVRPNLKLNEETLPAIVEICRRLDGIPLAIELAAARTRMLSPSQIARGVEERFHLLTGGARTALPRQRTLEASVEWSYALLSDPERTLFARLSVFPGSFDLDAAENVCSDGGIDRYSVLDLLSGLVDKSLVQTEDVADETRYRMLETIRHYARQKLSETTEAARVRTSHLDYYVAFAERTEPALERSGWAIWLDRLETELDNLRAAMDWALVSGEVEKNLRITGAAWSFWLVRSRHGEMQQILETGLSAGPTDPLVRAKALLAAASVWFTSDFHRTHAHAAEAAELARAGGDNRLLARGLCWTGWTQHWLGWGDGRPLVQEALDLERDVGDSLHLVRCLTFLGTINGFEGDPGSGRRYLEEALEVAERTGYTPGLGHALNFLGILEFFRGDLAAAEERLETCVDLGRQLRDRMFTALPLATLSLVATFRGEFEKADDAARAAMEIGHESGATIAEANGAYALAILQLARGELAATTDLLKPVLEGFRGSGLKVLVGEALWLLGLASLFREDHETARLRFDEMLIESPTSPWLRARALLGLAAVNRAEADAERGEALVHEALQLVTGADDRVGIVNCLELLAGVAADQQSPREAVRLYAAAETIRREIGYRRFPVEAPDYERELDALRTALSSDEFENAWNEGSSLTTTEAVAYASRGRGERKRPSAGWASLTPTELEVVRLVTAGLTNPEIAERLFVSRNTVKAHLSHAFTKLGIATRAELAAEATRRGLLATSSGT